MKPFDIIEKQKQDLNRLKYKLQYSKDKKTDANTINVIVDTLNCLNDILVSKYYTSALETLIYSLVYHILLENKIQNGGDLPINYVAKIIRQDLRMGLEHQKGKVISLLNTYHVTNLTKEKEFNLENMVDFDKLISTLVQNFKTDIVWNKK